MRWIITLLFFMFLLAAHAVIAPAISVWGAKPDFLVILVVQLAFQLPRPEGFLWPWFIGLATDLHDEGPLGVLAFTYGLIAFGIDRLREGVFTGALPVRLAAVAAADLVQDVALWISLIIRGQSPSFMLFWGHSILSVIYTTIAAAALMPLMSWALRGVCPKERR